MNIQWYPGHMTKAKRAMQEDVKAVDLIIEIVDARAPMATRNPDIESLGQGKSRMIVMNKADLADEEASAAWTRWFQSKGYTCFLMDARSRKNLKQLMASIDKACSEKRERDRKRGILNRPVRAMVAGIPNVGKSTLINTIAGKSTAKTGNKPGVTRGNQWIRLNKSVELLDTPGILWPKFEDPDVGLNLAFCGSIKDDILGVQDLGYELIRVLGERYPELLRERYKLEEISDQAIENMDNIALKRGFIMSGKRIDYERTGRTVLDEFRGGKIGRITLEGVS